MDVIEYIKAVKKNYDDSPVYNTTKYLNPETRIQELATGGVATPKRGLVDEPGSYGGDRTQKSLGGGLYEITSKTGSKTYQTVVYNRKTGKAIKTSFGSDKKAAAESLKKQKADRPPTKFEKIKEVKETKGTKEFKKITNKIDNKFSKIESKGYTNLEEFRNEMKNLVTKDKFSNQSETKLKISNYITDKFKDIHDVNTSNTEKALDKYNKIGGKEKGTINKIANEFGINKNTFGFHIQKTGRKIIPIKYEGKYEKRKAIYDKRKDAKLKFSDKSFEFKMRGTRAIQKSHMDDLYSRVVTAETLGYAPQYINQKVLKGADAYLNALYKKRDNLIKNKPAGYKKAIEEINQKGIKVASATKGYKSFQIMQPDGSTYQFGVDAGKTIDPTGITKGKQIKGNVKKVRFEGAKTPIATLTPDPVDQYFFEKNRQAVIESQGKVTKKKMKSIANALREVGFKCKFAGAEGGDVRCDDPKSYFDDINEKTKQSLGKGPQATKALKAMRFAKNILGPAAIAGELAIEGLFIANDILGTGKPLKQAFGESILNLALGPKLRVDVEAERAKEFAKGEDFAMAERGRRMAPFMAQGAPRKGQLSVPEERRLKNRMQQMEEVYPTTPVSQIDLALQDAGLTQQETGMTYSELQDYIKRQSQMQAIADAGGVANMASGGIASLTRTTPPERGPQYRGLDYLRKHGRKY